MTTVVYCSRSKTMASDTQVTCGPMKRRASKVKVLANGGLIAGSGDYSSLNKVFTWAEADFSHKSRPSFSDNPESVMTFECLLVKQDGSMWLIDDDLEVLEHKGDFIGIGSGGSMAVVAMACGKSPEEAVLMAAEYDPYTSAPVEVWSLPTKRNKPCPAKRSKSLPTS